MEEAKPFLAPVKEATSKLQFAALSWYAFALIQMGSIVNFFWPNGLGRILVLTDLNVKFILPLCLNLIVEDRLVFYLVNPVVVMILVNILLRFWNWRQICVYLGMVGLSSTLVIFVFIETFALIDENFHYRLCGSLPIMIGLTEAIVYASKGHRDVAVFTDKPCEFFWIIMVFALGTFTRKSLPGLVSVVVSYIVLQKLQVYVEFPVNETFSFRDFIPMKTQKEEEEKQMTSVIDSLGLTESPELSEADRNRRMRALRAIEERMESISLPL